MEAEGPPALHKVTSKVMTMADQIKKLATKNNGVDNSSITKQCVDFGANLTETEMVMPSGKSTSSVTMRCLASAVKGAADE